MYKNLYESQSSEVEVIHSHLDTYISVIGTEKFGRNPLKSRLYILIVRAAASYFKGNIDNRNPLKSRLYILIEKESINDLLEASISRNPLKSRLYILIDNPIENPIENLIDVAIL